MRPTTRSSEHGGSITASAIPRSSMPGSDESSSTSVGTGSAVPDIDDMTTWIERLRSLPRMTPITSSPSAIALSERSGGLNADQRAAVVLRFYSDLTVEQVARTVGAPVGTVRSRLHYGLKQLRRALEPDR